ncbi:MAG: SCO family protein [Acidobacteriaceae bacterium]|nr:SCO family protein [Acidobacteriaceae bacterium]
MRAPVLFRLTASFLLTLLVREAGLARGQKADSDSRHESGHPDTAYHGGLVTPPLPKPKFTLTDTSGARFDFRSQTDGHVTLLFFGFTNCPDVCPMQMSYLADALKKLPKNLADRFKIVFVTTDPDRDNPQVLRAWLNHLDKDFIGLTGSLAEVQAAQSAANMPLAKGAPDYAHSSFVLAYTRDNLAHVIYPAGVTQADWLHDLPQLAKEAWTK